MLLNEILFNTLNFFSSFSYWIKFSLLHLLLLMQYILKQEQIWKFFSRRSKNTLHMNLKLFFFSFNLWTLILFHYTFILFSHLWKKVKAHILIYIRRKINKRKKKGIRRWDYKIYFICRTIFFYMGIIKYLKSCTLLPSLTSIF